eukprot:6221836-Pyramimonas_sp.AAC.1
MDHVGPVTNATEGYARRCVEQPATNRSAHRVELHQMVTVRDAALHGALDARVRVARVAEEIGYV